MFSTGTSCWSQDAPAATAYPVAGEQIPAECRVEFDHSPYYEQNSIASRRAPCEYRLAIQRGMGEGCFDGSHRFYGLARRL
jgi:hypothetical protein